MESKIIEYGIILLHKYKVEQTEVISGLLFTFFLKNTSFMVTICRIYRSSPPEVFCKKGILRNYSKFTLKHLCQSLFFNKVAGLACNFIKKETLAQVFSCEFCEISKNIFSYRTPLVAASEFRKYSSNHILKVYKAPNQSVVFKISKCFFKKM